jgi:hypothetical protein
MIIDMKQDENVCVCVLPNIVTDGFFTPLRVMNSSSKFEATGEPSMRDQVPIVEFQPMIESIMQALSLIRTPGRITDSLIRTPSPITQLASTVTFGPRTAEGSTLALG